MTEELKEYITFTIIAKDGSEVELAVVDEFEFEHKNYVVGAVIEGDVINEDGQGIVQIEIAKHRNGKVGTVKLRWISEWLKFVDRDYNYKPASKVEEDGDITEVQHQNNDINDIFEPEAPPEDTGGFYAE